MKHHLFFSLLLALCIGGCARAKAPDLPHSNRQKSNLTTGMVKKYVKVGEATQTDILAVFGAPNIITRDKNGHEVWTYDRQSMATASEIAAWNATGSAGAVGAGIVGDVPIGGAATAGGSTGKSSSASQISSATFTLMITFDESEAVKDYRMMATQF
jgi:hypothetical protein